MFIFYPSFYFEYNLMHLHGNQQLVGRVKSIYVFVSGLITIPEKIMYI